MWDEDHNGVPFAHGATLLAGSVNNPMALIAYQVKKLSSITPNSPLHFHVP